MDDADDRAYVRAPTLEDLARICASLNASGARYVLIGGFAVISHGSVRTTKDIDLLVDPAPENVARIKTALSILEDNAAAEIAEGQRAHAAAHQTHDPAVRRARPAIPRRDA